MTEQEFEAQLKEAQAEIERLRLGADWREQNAAAFKGKRKWEAICMEEHHYRVELGRRLNAAVASLRLIASIGNRHMEADDALAEAVEIATQALDAESK